MSVFVCVSMSVSVSVSISVSVFVARGALLRAPLPGERGPGALVVIYYIIIVEKSKD